MSVGPVYPNEGPVIVTLADCDDVELLVDEPELVQVNFDDTFTLPLHHDLKVSGVFAPTVTPTEYSLS